MTLTDKLAALPPYYRTVHELAEAEGTSSAIRLMVLQNEALHAYNALLCDALEALLFHHDAACSSFTKCEAETDAKDILAACEVKP